MSRRILLFGGTFDPPHNGHMELLRAFAQSLEQEGGRVLFAPARILELSSTQIRAKVKRGEALSGLVPVEVEKMIDWYGLYRPGKKEGKNT